MGPDRSPSSDGRSKTTELASGPREGSAGSGALPVSLSGLGPAEPCSQTPSELVLGSRLQLSLGSPMLLRALGPQGWDSYSEDGGPTKAPACLGSQHVPRGAHQPSRGREPELPEAGAPSLSGVSASVDSLWMVTLSLSPAPSLCPP